MDQLQWIKSRRSTRRFADRPVEAEKLEQIIEAGRFAPSGCNNQSTHFLVIRNRAVLEKLAELVQSEFAAQGEDSPLQVSCAGAIRASKAGSYRYDYHTPILIVTANGADYGNAMADCACALENMMLMANGLDLGSCWINQLRWLNGSKVLNAYLRKLGMGESEIVYGSLALGYPDSEDGLPNRTPAARTGNPVSYID